MPLDSVNHGREDSSYECVRIWYCECGRIHAETKHQRLTFEPNEFLLLIHQAKEKRKCDSAMESL